MTRIDIIPPYSMAEYEAEISWLLRTCHSEQGEEPPSSGISRRSFAALKKADTGRMREGGRIAGPRKTGSGLEERFDFFSKAFLNRLFGANGEGEQGEFDQRPLFRTDYFDCVTYVNTVLAMAISENIEDFRNNIIKINYRDAKPVYENRHHFLSIDWNPGNETLGLIQDISDTLEVPLEIAEANIDRNGFFQHKQFQDIKLLAPISSEQEERLLKKLHEIGASVEPVKSVVKYLPLKNLLPEKNWKAFREKLPNVSLAEMVRPNWDLTEKIGTHLNFSHLGLLFKQGDQLRFRHATITHGKVLEVDFWKYLKEFEASPTLKGIKIFSF